MSKRDKLLEKARRNPAGLGFEDLLTLMRQCGWVHDHTTGSHQIWYSPLRHRLSVQPGSHGKAKGYQVRQFLERYDSETGDE